MPRRLLVFAPHPDDAAISTAALMSQAVEMGVQVTVVLVTDGSEARLPDAFLARHGWTREMAPEQARALRGRIRVAEAMEEAERLGAGVVQLEEQSWFREHRTPAECLNEDLSLRDVERFVPGRIDGSADEIAWVIRAAGSDCLCAAPMPGDRLEMHRIVTRLVRCAGVPVLGYECLSTVEIEGDLLALPFDEARMAVKCHAIVAHESMRARRQEFGGYANPGSEFYDDIVRRKNGESAREWGLQAPYAERYAWLR